ncbi:von Willebrand factor D and EGF domain-containing protein [Stylophora pistillata]|uniref:von Willebrand factor D and EGF domain-containing protein n=1 Tax=Stylophora pistillata TaxID=50429 RepID=A0A2B4R8S5_STYPI|nr:von Willebrand factor D and EGF domain-containing protein [Stylophora pistillata]
MLVKSRNIRPKHSTSAQAAQQRNPKSAEAAHRHCEQNPANICDNCGRSHSKSENCPARDTNGPAIIGPDTATQLNLVKFNLEVKQSPQPEPCTQSVKSAPIRGKRDLIARHQECLNGIGKFKGEYQITLDPAVTPVVHHPHKVPISMKDEESSYLTTLNSPYGSYRFKRMPFGLKMSQDIFQTRIDQTFERCDGVIGIANDIVIYGDSEASHDANMNGMISRCKETGLKLNTEKCFIKQDQFKFYGIICTKDGIQLDPIKVSALKQMASSANKKGPNYRAHSSPVSVIDESDNIGSCSTTGDPHYGSLFLQNVAILTENDGVPGSKFKIDPENDTVEQLKRWLKCRGIKQGGKRCDLVKVYMRRLIASLHCHSTGLLSPLWDTEILSSIAMQNVILRYIQGNGSVQNLRPPVTVGLFFEITMMLLSSTAAMKTVILIEQPQYELKYAAKNDWHLDYQSHKPYQESIADMCLEPSESYFNRLPDPVNDSAVEYEIPCSCNRKDENGTAECIKELPVYFPNVMDGTGNVILLTGNSNKKKRDTHISDDLTDKDYALFKGLIGSNKSHRRRRALYSKRKFTMENATDYCMEKVSKTDIGNLCAILGVNVSEIITSCSIDLKASGDPAFAISAISVLLNNCGEIVARNLSLYSKESNVNTQGNSSSSILTNIAQKMCPNDCSLNGKCVNASCICNEGFTAKDCAMSLGNAPFISMLQGSGLCDKRQRPCKKVTVMGNGFINSTNVTCHVKEYKVINSSWTPDKTIQRFPGVMTDLVLVECHLPDSPVKHNFFDDTVEGTPAAGLSISVSNDGANPSHDELSFISYDSGCMSCNISSGCLVKSNSCLINQYCFAANEMNPTDFCSQCLPEISKNTWTKRQVNLAPKFASTSQYYAVFQETLELPIDVLDPEGMPLVVSLVNGGPTQAIIQQNVLIWNATKDIMTHFLLKATDACQAVSSHNITVSLVNCQCQNHGRCVPHPDKPRGSGYYECHCLPGFTGDKCETDINECELYPCLRGRCVDGVNNFTCICYPGYVGRTCNENYDDCSSLPCIHGNCTDYVNAYGCSCEPGYTGKNCSIDIDDCQASPCKNGTCYDALNGYTCQCNDGFTGYDCNVNIDECKSNPCIYGTCVDLVNNYTCNCYAGFTGRNCDILIANCAKDSCFPNVTCYEKGNSIICGPCPSGLTGDGKRCEDPTENVKEKLPYPLIIGTSCGVIFAIAVVSICLIRHCQRQKRLDRRFLSNGMPAEVSFPDPEKYELQEAQSKENNVTYEELSTWKDCGYYERLHFSNGGGRCQEIGIANMASDSKEISTRNINDCGHYQEIGKARDPEHYQQIGIVKS